VVHLWQTIRTIGPWGRDGNGPQPGDPGHIDTKRLPLFLLPCTACYYSCCACLLCLSAVPAAAARPHVLFLRSTSKDTFDSTCFRTIFLQRFRTTHPPRQHILRDHRLLPCTLDADREKPLDLDGFGCLSHITELGRAPSATAGCSGVGVRHCCPSRLGHCSCSIAQTSPTREFNPPLKSRQEPALLRTPGGHSNVLVMVAVSHRSRLRDGCTRGTVNTF